MNVWSFTVPGTLWGYRQGRKEAHRPERVAFKNLVRLYANIEGIPGRALEEDRPFLYVRIHWKRKPRIDGKNVAGLIEDALWTQDRGVAGGLWYKKTFQPREEVIVTIIQPLCIDEVISAPRGCRIIIGAGEA